MKKRTCYGCRALSDHRRQPRCDLRFPILSVRANIEGLRGVSNPVPEEECPKPRTYKQFLDELAAMRERQKQATL